MIRRHIADAQAGSIGAGRAVLNYGKRTNNGPLLSWLLLIERRLNRADAHYSVDKDQRFWLRVDTANVLNHLGSPPALGVSRDPSEPYGGTL